MSGEPPVLLRLQEVVVRFTGPNGMWVSFRSADGLFGESSQAPFNKKLLAGSVYRLKMSDIPNRPGVELYPSLELTPGPAIDKAVGSHEPLPLALTEEEANCVAANQLVTRILLLPNSEHKDDLKPAGPPITGSPFIAVSSVDYPDLDILEKAARLAQ